MLADWLGLLLTVWVACPDAAASALGHPSYRHREAAQALCRVVGESGGGFGWHLTRGVPTPLWPAWMRHGRFWWGLTRAAYSHPDAEVRARAARAVGDRRISRE